MKFNTHSTTPPHWILACIFAVSLVFFTGCMTDADSGSDDDEQITNPTENPSNPSTSGENTTPSSPSNPDSGNTSISYTITFNLNDGVGTLPVNISAKSGEEITLPACTFTRTGYEFKDWCATADGTGTTCEAGSKVKDLTAENGATVTLYAKWVLAGNWSISYELNGGTNDESNPAEYNIESAVTLADPTRSFYEFAGWYDNTEFSGEKLTGWNVGAKTGDIRLYAKWVLAGNWSISYELNGGTNDESNPAEYNIETAVTLADPTRNFYEFAGWYDNAEFSGEKLTGWNAGAKTGDIKLYAKWSLTQASISSAIEAGATEIRLSGEISEDTINMISEALKKNSSKKLAVDLSQTTGLTTIDWKAFKDCSNLTSVSIPGSVTSIDWEAFSGCTSLAELTVSESNETYKSYENCIYTKDGKSFVMAAKGLTSVTFLEGVTFIENEAFYDCSNLNSVTIPNSVTEIKSSAFYYCRNLKSVSISDSVTFIGDTAFDDCTSLTELTVSESNEKYKSYENCIYTKDGKTFVMAAQGLTSVTFLEGVESIYSGAFRKCLNLTNVTIPDSVHYIDSFVFINCRSLISVNIPDGITSIRDSTFNNCSNLKSVTIPDSVTSIGSYAFFYCSNLITVNFKGSEEQWNKLKANAVEKGGNEALTGVTVNIIK